jgi:hypothetical protein
MTSVLDFIKIYQFVQKLLGGTRRQTDRQTGDLISLTFLFRESSLKMCLREVGTFRIQNLQRTPVGNLCILERITRFKSCILLPEMALISEMTSAY